MPVSVNAGVEKILTLIASVRWRLTLRRFTRGVGKIGSAAARTIRDTARWPSTVGGVPRAPPLAAPSRNSAASTDAGAFPNSCVAGTVHHEPDTFHCKCRDAFLTGGPPALAALFERCVVLDDAREARRGLEAGVLERAHRGLE